MAANKFEREKALLLLKIWQKVADRPHHHQQLAPARERIASLMQIMRVLRRHSND